MSVTNYYDPLYGRLKLHPIVREMISRNSELIRLRSIGMMNFRSLNMLSLTSVSRLEHSIGITYLVELFSRKNRAVAARLPDFMTAALYHDINCASFGHAVEWAIDRHNKYEHESSSKWVSTKETLSCPEDKPIYFKQDGLHRNRYKDRYKIDFYFINEIIAGKNTCVINSTGIDLDNIDNVCRMAFYLGMLKDTSLPIRLAESLLLTEDQGHFLIDDDSLLLVEEWLKIRSMVYRQFLYSKEYMGFEYLIFLLVRLYADKYGSQNVRELFHYTDEWLLWTHFKSSHGEEVVATARRLLLHDIPDCYVILRSPTFSRFQEARSPRFCEELIRDIKKEAGSSGLFSIEEGRSLAVHVTSDNKKTNRSITIMLFDSAGVLIPKTIGEDSQYILFAILGNVSLSPAKIEALSKIGIEILNRQGFIAEVAQFAEQADGPQKTLF